ncbi:8-oxo-dGTP diphosphatase MutT [Marinomonas transparens]|uniref:8-oxo-dGTP diphosphatase n=1 Tax=Marinomonas transparens TaxID=2795388 RepID=A0A934JKM9_9GAMM|nr:8-oxo-dGTP diphosphatase MutT [Marinomonas transparens]MBJ7537571.1 8-oxo-dGTP diphosphatase MutT [Marinomonas transparens]
MKLVRVSAGIITRNDQVFIALRKPDQHQGDLWEFPGGKCDQDESPESALVRELEEECGIAVRRCVLFKTVSHDYGDKLVELFFFQVDDFEGEPSGQEGQEVRWVSMSHLLSYDFPEANKVIVEALTA